MPSPARLHAVSTSQLTLDFEPSLPERFRTCREYVAHRVQVQPKPQKTIAADMDLSPSVLSRKLTPGETDTQRFNLDDFENYLATTGDVEPILYLVAKYMQTDEVRRIRALARVESLAADLDHALKSLRGAV